MSRPTLGSTQAPIRWITGVLPLGVKRPGMKPCENFVYLPYYSESELCGGAVTVSIFELPPLESYARLTTLHPPLVNVLQIVHSKLQGDSGTGGFELLSPEIAWG
jgi:hypothetical protein